MNDNYLLNIKYLPLLPNEGPWNTEPDILLWECGSTLCLIYRHPTFYTLNGYINTNTPEEDLLGVHGGITYNEKFPPTDNEEVLKYVDNNKRWLGFDTAHCWDYLPYSFSCLSGSVYRDLDYVKRQVESMLIYYHI